MARTPDPGARERILAAAARRFAGQGVHAVGLQQIIDDCGCGKNVLYREFGSKDELVVAYLQACRDDWTAITDRAARMAPDDPARQLIEIVAGTVDAATDEEFRGCPLRNAFPEFPDPEHPVHQVVVTHYADRQAHLRDLARRTGAADPDALADRIALIIDGLNGNAPVLGRDGATRGALAFAEDVVRAATAGAVRETGRRAGRGGSSGRR